MTANIATVTAKGQVTIPKAVRDALRIQQGGQRLCGVEGARAVLTPLARRPLKELYGALPATRPFPGQQAIRAEVRTDLGERLADRWVGDETGVDQVRSVGLAPENLPALVGDEDAAIENGAEVGGMQGTLLGLEAVVADIDALGELDAIESGDVLPQDVVEVGRRCLG